MFIYTVTCNKKSCPNQGVEYRMPDQSEPVQCGGCGNLIETIKTDEECLFPDYGSFTTSYEA